LLQHAKDILSQLEYARRAVLRANELCLTQVTIGCAPNAPDPVPTAMQELRRLAPGVEVKLCEGPTSQQIDGLLTGKLDLAFVHPSTQQIRGLEIRLVERRVPMAAIPAEWALSENREVHMADFADQTLLLPSDDVAPEYNAAIVAAFRTAGVTPRISHEASYNATRLRLVSSGMGMSLISGAGARAGYPGVVFRPIADLPGSVASEMYLAWRRGLPAPVRKLLMTTYESVRRQ